jgi:hypothetical protein
MSCGGFTLYKKFWSFYFSMQHIQGKSSFRTYFEIKLRHFFHVMSLNYKGDFLQCILTFSSFVTQVQDDDSQLG